MRFAYIDSQGNEVPIPSVDALALRIELGAIKADTQLYDAQADHWAPAETHEIFHSLQRDSAGGGFVAPPPPMTGPPPAFDAPAPEETPPAALEAEEAETLDAPAAAAAKSPELPSFDLVGDPPAAPADGPASFHSVLADELSAVPGYEPPPASQVEEAPPAPAPGGFDLSFDLRPNDLDEAATEPEPAPPVVDKEADGFDFSGGLELEESLTDAAASGDAWATGTAPTLDADSLVGPDDSAMDFGGGASGGLELESPMGFAGDEDAMDFSGDGLGGGLELETPMSGYTAEDPPGWMEETGPSTPPDAMDFSKAAVAPGDVDAERPSPPKREPRSRPSPPRRPKNRSLPIGLIVGVLAVAGVGAGGYFGWQVISGGSNSGEAPAPELAAVVIPDIPAELLPQMRDLAEDAVSAMLAEFASRGSALGIPPEPNGAWLGGAYLANASAYPDVEQFWLSIERFVDQVRGSDFEVFHAKYLEQIATAGVAPDIAAQLVERADSGFVAARDGRFVAYNQMDDLVNASLNLHQFLLDNEELIDYDPAASGVSEDPVLEAVPATEELRDEMWGLVGGITGALQDLGTLNQVTTERLFAVLFDRMRSAGVR